MCINGLKIQQTIMCQNTRLQSRSCLFGEYGHIWPGGQILSLPGIAAPAAEQQELMGKGPSVPRKKNKKIKIKIGLDRVIGVFPGERNY